MPILQPRPVSGLLFEQGIGVLESHHRADFFMDWTRGANLGVFYILNGEGSLWTKPGKYPLKKGTVAVVPKETLYRIVDTPGHPLSLYLLVLNNPEIERGCLGRDPRNCRVTTHRLTCSLVQKLIKEILYEQTMKRPGWPSMMTGLTLQLIGTLSRSWLEKSEAKPPVQESPSISRARVAGYIQDLAQHFYRPQNLEQAAASTGLHVRRFSALFQEFTGTSWLAHLREKRISYAKRLLSETDRSIISICFECGFEELSTFYRAFRQIENTSPKAWRDRKRKKSPGRSGRPN